MVFKKKRLQGMACCLALMTVILLAACTEKANPTGNNWSNVRPITITDSTSFFAGFSFPAVGEVTGDEDNLLCGDFNGAEAIAVMRFSGLPEDFSIPAGYQDSTWLQLTLVRRSPVTRYPVNLRVYKLNQAWAPDSTNLIQDANMTLITPQEFTIPDTILAQGTDIRIPIPPAALEDWSSEADSLGLSLVVKTGAASYVEIREEATGRGPQLRFKYRLEGDTEDREYSMRASKDSHRIDAGLAPLLADRWVIRNINPSRLYVNFAMDYSRFVDNNGAPLSETQRKRATINKAQLIFYARENPYYGTNTQYSLRGDRVDDSLYVGQPIEILDEHTASGITSELYVRGDSVVVNITPLIQAYSSGDNEPWGVVIKSMQELLNFGELELWHFIDAPQGKKPKLQITYTPPFL